LQGFLGELRARDVRVVAISVDPPDVSKKHAAKQGYTFPILSDEELEVLRRYDLVHEGGFRGADISKPAEFLLDAEGVVVWRNLTDDYKVRLTAEQLRKGLDALGVTRKDGK
jgi:peroxiredoxin